MAMGSDEGSFVRGPRRRRGDTMGQNLELDAGTLPAAQHNIHIVLHHHNHKLVEYYDKHHGGFDHYQRGDDIVIILHIAFFDINGGPGDHYHVGRRDDGAIEFVEHNHAWGDVDHTHAPGGSPFRPSRDRRQGDPGDDRPGADVAWRWVSGRAPRTEAH